MNKMSECSKNQAPSNCEIDLIQLIKYIWGERKFVIKITSVFVFFGLLIAFITPVEYQSKTVFIAQNSDGSSGMKGLSGLAAMAGVNLASSASIQTLPPVLYPQIVSSAPFKKELLESYITFGDDSVSLYDYYYLYKQEHFMHKMYKYTLGLPFTIISCLNDGENSKNSSSAFRFISFTKSEFKISNLINSNITLVVDDENNSVTVCSNSGNALTSAEIASNYVDILQKFITKFRVKKALEQYMYILDRYNEKKLLVDEMQNRIAKYKDNNKNLTSAESQIQFQSLNNDYNVIFSVYSELAKQLEQAKLQVKHDTPVFTIIDPVSIPTQKNKPKKLVYLIISFVLGFGISIIGLSFKYSFKA